MPGVTGVFATAARRKQEQVGAVRWEKDVALSKHGGLVHSKILSSLKCCFCKLSSGARMRVSASSAMRGVALDANFCGATVTLSRV
jgi:hypothetical protein